MSKRYLFERVKRILNEAKAVHAYHPEKETPPYKTKIPAFHEFITNKHLITITEPSDWSLMDIHVYDRKRKETLYSAGYKNGHGKPWGLWTNKATMVDDFKKHKVPKHEIKSIFKQVKKHVEKHIGGTISDDPLHHDIWDNDGNM